MIPALAVEAAARLLYERDLYATSLDDAPTHRRHRYLDEAEGILEAVAPHMLAPVTELADELVLSALTGTAYQAGRGSGFRIAGTRIRHALGLRK